MQTPKNIPSTNGGKTEKAAMFIRRINDVKRYGFDTRLCYCRLTAASVRQERRRDTPGTSEIFGPQPTGSVISEARLGLGKKGKPSTPHADFAERSPSGRPPLQASINHMQHDTLPLFLQCKHILSFCCSDRALVFI